MSDDDFEEIVRGGTDAPCTLRCCLLGGGRGGRAKAKRVTVTFRADKLDPEVVAVLRAPRLSAAYSPSQRAVRVRADPAGQFQLARAPRGRGDAEVNVWLLRFPWPEKMPWVEKRASVTLDVNPDQGAVFIEVPQGQDQINGPVYPGPTLALPPPRAQLDRAGAGDARESVGGLKITRDTLGRGLLTPLEAAALHLIANNHKMNKATLKQVLEQQGFEVPSVNGLLGRVKPKLAEHMLELTHGTDGSSVWFGPQSLAALRRLVEENG